MDDPNAYAQPLPETSPDITAYLERLIGWGPGHRAQVERAADAVGLARQRRSHLALIGHGDLVPIALAIHRRTIGSARFVVVDPRRREDPCITRSITRSLPTLAQAMDAAHGGTVCIRAIRRPPDWFRASARLATEDVRLTVCYPDSHVGDIELSRTAVVVPPIAGRDIERLIDEYASDATADMGAALPLTGQQRAWIASHCADHHALDVAVRRFVALSWRRGVCAAAHQLGMAPVSLSRWMRRRGLTVEMVLGTRAFPAREIGE